MPLVITDGSVEERLEFVNEINPGATVLYNGARLTISSEVVTTSAAVAPTLTASDSYDAETRTLTISVDSFTGSPTPSRTLTTLTLGGVDVLENATGTGPWSYVVPDSASSLTVAWTVTATNSVDSATASGSEVVAANLTAPAQMSAPTLTGGEEAATLTLAAAPANGGSAITGYGYEVDLASGDFSNAVATGTVAAANRADPIDLSPLAEGSYKARNWATNAVGSGTPSVASANATVTAVADPPTYDEPAYDDETRTLSIPNLSEGGTFVWATSLTGNVPTFTVADGWAGDANYETGSTAITPGDDVSVDITATTPDGSRKLTFYIYDADGDLSEAGSVAITVDNTAPTVSTETPEDDATDVAVDTNLVMDFPESMARQGTVTLKAVGGGTIETFDLSTDGTWSTVTNTDDRITLNPTSDLGDGEGVAVQWSGLEDKFGNPLPDNATDTTWNFTTVAAASSNILAATLADCSDASQWGFLPSGISITGGVLRFDGTQAQFDDADIATGARPSVSASTEYEFEIEVVSVTSGGNFRFQINYYDSGGGFLGSSQIPASTYSVTTTGVTEPFSFTTPASTAAISIKVADMIGGLEVDFDNLLVREA